MKKLVLMLGISFGLSSTLAMAAPKIGVVDLQKALLEVKKGKATKELLEKEVVTRRADFEKKQAAMQKEQAEFRKQLEAAGGVLKGAKQQEKAQALEKKAFEFNEAMKKAQEEMQQKEVQLTRPIIEGLRSMLAEVARKRDLENVFDVNAMLYALDKVDVTEQLIKAYDEKNP